ncbi:MAG: hypothetical protein GXO63_00730 [Candidatus Micrarchaeota archaeon]|nr:hypothetical protein [Candidatus Micrarchaeota archaeon]
MRYTKYCSQCGLCIAYKGIEKICPRKNTVEIRNDLLGEYEEILFVKGKYRGTYSGAIVSTLLAAKENGLIDGVLGVEKGKTIIHGKPRYVKNINEIKKLSGMRHTVVPLLSILREIPKNEKIAIVGLPCHMEAISILKKKKLLKHNIRYTISIACGTNFKPDKFHNLIQSYGINLNDVIFYTLRDTRTFEPYFLFIDKTNKRYEIPVSKTTECIANGCIYCTDYLGFDSDVSFGALGAPKGWSVAFVRNEKGKRLIDIAYKDGYISIRKPTENFFSKLISNFYKHLPIKFYLYIAFKTNNPVGAELMAKFKIHYLNHKLRKLREV